MFIFKYFLVSLFNVFDCFSDENCRIFAEFVACKFAIRLETGFDS